MNRNEEVYAIARDMYTRAATHNTDGYIDYPIAGDCFHAAECFLDEAIKRGVAGESETFQGDNNSRPITLYKEGAE